MQNQAAHSLGLSSATNPGLAAALHLRRIRQAYPRPLPALNAPSSLQPSSSRSIGCSDVADQQRADREVRAAAGPYDSYTYSPSSYGATSYGSQPNQPGAAPQQSLSAPARAALARATSAMRRYGWLAFWIQLTLSVVSGVILLFSVAFTTQGGPKASLYLTLMGILAGFLSTFWAYGYQRISMRMQEYLDGADVAKIKKQTVIETITKGVLINVAGMGATLLGISTLVGVLVAKTLSNATVNPFIASAAGAYNPVLALDVFLVQAATNTLLGHFLSLLCSLWLLNVIGEGRGLHFQRQQHIQKLKSQEEEGVTGRSMSGSLYQIKGGGANAGALGALGSFINGGVSRR